MQVGWARGWGQQAPCGPLTPKAPFGAFLDVEREKGIEPSLFAWEAKVLPLNDSRVIVIVLSDERSSAGGSSVPVHLSQA